ncbi:5'-methylthioadenosine/S-adenosylhomocysteine nucleosidase [compost metagenome]
MKILIVDDVYDKASMITRCALASGLMHDNIEYVTNTRDALVKVAKEKYDLLFLDLQLPERMGEPINKDGGRNFLETLEINTKVNKPTYIVAITQHQESYDENIAFFTEKGWVLIGGDHDENILKELITSKCKYVDEIQKFDLAIIVALEHTELQAVLQLPFDWQRFLIDGDPTIYYAGKVTLADGTVKSIVCASCPRMGMVSSSSITTKICIKFSPQYVIMTGISAGIKGKVNLGDILIADPVWDWGCGKLTQAEGKSKMLYSPHQVSLDSTLRSIFISNSVSKKHLAKIYDKYPKQARKPSYGLAVHVGPVASGAVVLEDPETVVYIKEQHRNTIGVEMEAYGVAAAAAYSSTKPPKTIIIKSVCDFADPEKNDDWQEYAAFTSAQYAYETIVNDLDFT